MNWMQARRYTYVLSISLIVIAMIPLILGKLELGIEFTGGVRWSLSGEWDTIGLPTQEVVSRTNAVLDEQDLAHQSAQLTGDQLVLTLDELPVDQKATVQSALESSLGTPLQELQLQAIGPTFGRSLMLKTGMAILLAALATLAYVSRQFANWRFGAAAVLAMLHDMTILLGVFGWLGWVGGIQVDILLVTAVLTTLSFSLHDTIVMFDRIRKLQVTQRGASRESIANQAITQTLIRSLNNSMTIIFMLAALVLLGGDTLRWFALALLTGTILGTYSSPFVAVPLYVDIHNRYQKQ